MPRILTVGSLLLAIALAIFMAVSGISHTVLAAAAVIAAVIGLIGLGLVAWDRYIPDEALRPRETGTIERYFQRWLTEFGREQGLFATAANDNVIPTRFRDERQMTFDGVADVVEYYPRFVLIGEPGEGKSSAIRTLVAQAIYNYRHSNGETPLPLWINLGFNHNPVDAGELIGYWWYEQHRLPGNPDVYLSRNNLILYLDGLNEMPEQGGGTRRERAESLRQFLQRYPRIPVIVTSRIREYEDDQDLNLGIPVLRVQPLMDRHIQNYTNNQLGSPDFWEILYTNTEQRRLASSAYRLRMMMEVYQANPSQSLPQDLHSLTTRYLHVRYDDLARAGKVRIKSWEDLERRLQEFAFRLIVRGMGTAVSTAQAQQILGREALKDAFDLRFLRHEGDMVRFYNHTQHGFFATPLLVDAMKNGNPKERITPHSIDTIRQIGDLGEIAVSAVPELIQTLQSKDNMVRRISAFALGRIGEGAAPAVPMLVTALADDQQEVREFAAFALGRIGEGAAPAVPALMPALQDKNSVVRFGAALALRQMGEAAAPAMPALIIALQDENQLIGQLAALALGEIGTNAASAIPSLAQMMRNTNADVRYSASYALGQMGEPAVPVLIAALETGKADYRIPAALALREIGRKALSAVPALILSLNDQNPDVRRSVAFALEKMNTPEAEEALRQYYDTQPKEA